MQHYSELTPSTDNTTFSIDKKPKQDCTQNMIVHKKNSDNSVYKGSNEVHHSKLTTHRNHGGDVIYKGFNTRIFPPNR